jgi:hypothetical protein
MGPSEHIALPRMSPEFKREIAAAIGLNCPQTHARRYASAGVAVGKGFERCYGSRDFAHRAIILLRIDWLSCLIGALLLRLLEQLRPLRDLAPPANLPGRG